MFYGIVTFLIWALIVQQSAAFFLGLANKWGWLEWLQVHAPSDMICRLFSCKFCCSWWMNVIISIILCVVTGNWWLAAIPVFATPITKELW